MAWNQSSETPSDKPSARTRGKTAVASGRRPYQRGLLAGLIVVIGVVVIWLFVSSSGGKHEEPAPKEEAKPMIKEEKPSLASKPVGDTVELTVHGQKKTVEVKKDDGYFYMKYPSGRVVRTKDPYLMKAMEEQARRFKDQPKPEPRDYSQRRYKSSATCLMAQYAVPGEMASPPGPISDREAVGFLEEKIEIAPDDTERDIEEKEYLVELQAEFREYMKNGGKAEAFFNKAYERQQIEREAVETAKREIRALVQEGKDEDARTALETYNKYLQEKGIRPIKATKNLFRRSQSRN